jgi:manganese oxidase
MGQSERNALGILSAAVAVFALVVAGIAVAVSNSNSNDSGGGGGSGGGGSAPITIDVTLAEFSITPNKIEAPAGTVVLNVTNAGTMVHNLTVEGVGATPDIKPGESYTLDLGSLKEGSSYKTLCTIAGHEAAGMVGTLVVVAPGGSTGGGTDTTPTTVVTDAQMNDSMLAGINTFLDVNGLRPDQPQIEMLNWGKENQPLEPKIVDGVKEFFLEASEFDWEVEPGKIVKAWGYNGTVPGPILRVDPGDKIRIVFKNSLSQTSSIHPHGCTVPNNMDGFDPVTGPSTLPGETTTLEWTAPELPTVCMYHSHHDAQVQVPMGLAGALLIGDMPLPSGLKADQEVVMTLNDAGNIGLSLNGRSFPGTQGYVMKAGETMLVHYYNEGMQTHPMHMHGPHGLIVAKDGVPLPAPYYGDVINVAPGERWSVLYTMPATVSLDGPDVWVWHCHILTHAETTMGYRYMATAIVVLPDEAVGTFQPGSAELDPRFSTYLPELGGEPVSASTTSDTSG